MKRLISLSLIIMVMSFNAICSDKSSGKVVYSLDFSKCKDGPAEAYLKKIGFKLKKGMADSSEVKLYFKSGKLYIDTLESSLGLAIKEGLRINRFSKIRIEWGVDKYPAGASYAKKVNNEAIMIYIYFGLKKSSSDSFFIPNSPYFMGLFLAPADKLNHPYIGRHFTTQGRFVCIANPKQGETITSEFNLVNTFKKYYKKSRVPFISGINIETDTSYVKPGKSRAFISKIEIIE
jgi:hypothetical protein